jgi:putative intracellular protease/amidase
MTKVVIVSTSAATCKGHPTGLWLEELAVPYYQFKSLGYEVIIASPTGGPIPIDASSLKGKFFNDDCKKFMVRETLLLCEKVARPPHYIPPRPLSSHPTFASSSLSMIM